MTAATITMPGPTKGPAVGRKRQPQSKEIARTLAGKFGRKLSELADRAGMSADELGVRIGKSGDTVRLYYSGRVVPHLNDWPKLAKALSVSPADLIT